MHVALDGSLLGARFSGVERSVAQIARHLPRVGGPDDRFTLYTSQAFDRYVAQFHPDGFCDDPRLEIIRAPFDSQNRSARIWWQQMVFPRLVTASGADLLHAPAYIAPIFAPKPHVVTLYDLIIFEKPEYCTLSNRAYYGLFLPPGTRWATRVIVSSSAARRSVARYLPHLWERTVTVPLGADPAFGQPHDDDAKIRELLGLPEHYLLWVGNVEPKKNLKVLLEALALSVRRGFDPPTLALVGELSWGTSDVKRLFLELGLQKRVMFLGRVSDTELPAIYRGADLFCFPSLAEGFGLPVVEAMAAGVPTLVSSSGALPETGGDAVVVLPPHDATAWADGIEQVLGSADQRARMIAAGRARAAQLTWENAARETLAVYQTAIAAGEEADERAYSGIIFPTREFGPSRTAGS